MITKEIFKERYIDINGKLRRESIAMDVKYGYLKHSDIVNICKFEEMKKEFFGNLSDLKLLPKEEWDKNYLDIISYAVVSKCFNYEYLLYLADVCNHLKSKKTSNIVKKSAFAVAASIAVAVVTCVVYEYLNS